MEISAKEVKKLRDSTGAGMMDAKEALKESDGNLEEAIKLLRKKGLADSKKRENAASHLKCNSCTLRLPVFPTWALQRAC